MYTQCEHCKAIFRVNMREVSIAKGKLRCGECKEVFLATSNLSTTLPEPFQPNVHIEELSASPPPNVVNPTRSKALKQPAPPQFTVKSIEKDSQKNKINWLSLLGILLALLLFAQVLYNNRHLFINIPKHSPEKVEMLMHNVFVHPNESGVLLISGSMINNAKYPQAYPILELRLTNAQSKVISLRRFKPSEYLDKYSNSMLLPSNEATSLKLKIKDPGDSAKRFQFGFL